MSIRLHVSPVLPTEGFTHGFPERTGGVSTGLRSSLNLGKRWGDDVANVERNRTLLAEHAGYDPGQLVATRHVHGTNVYKVGEPLVTDAEFDGLVCDRVGPVLGAFAADCIPILFADPEARVCGAAHAGWRGTVAGIAANVVTRMVELGARPERVRVALGPSIGPCCFEVGPEVVAEFRAALGELTGLVVGPGAGSEFRPLHPGTGPRKDHIDLRVATRAILERAGVRRDLIDDRPPCTRCEGDRFFSYRRDGIEGGVHMAFIGLT
ncbi:MAG: peptidoglycan editing factor PgeF [Deltaproteobacteria bacterium]|nr:peptidoglycan editing factor PgeF [Deltaproteobacteria bacterium]MDQ3301148.1 peptidoglycan editing factor PgeF [Myxococcota bacterium]